MHQFKNITILLFWLSLLFFNPIAGLGQIQVNVLSPYLQDCGSDDGVISVTADGDAGPFLVELFDSSDGSLIEMITINGSHNFESLGRGEYAIRIHNNFGCMLDESVSILCCSDTPLIGFVSSDKKLTVIFNGNLDYIEEFYWSGEAIMGPPILNEESISDFELDMEYCVTLVGGCKDVTKCITIDGESNLCDPSVLLSSATTSNYLANTSPFISWTADYLDAFTESYSCCGQEDYTTSFNCNDLDLSTRSVFSYRPINDVRPCQDGGFITGNFIIDGQLFENASIEISGTDLISEKILTNVYLPILGWSEICTDGVYCLFDGISALGYPYSNNLLVSFCRGEVEDAPSNPTVSDPFEDEEVDEGNAPSLCGFTMACQAIEEKQVYILQHDLNSGDYFKIEPRTIVNPADACCSTCGLQSFNIPARVDVSGAVSSYNSGECLCEFSGDEISSFLNIKHEIVFSNREIKLEFNPTFCSSSGCSGGMEFTIKCYDKFDNPVNGIINNTSNNAYSNSEEDCLDELIISEDIAMNYQSQLVMIEAKNRIESESRISKNSNVVFGANDKIMLKSGFKTESGIKFKAQTDGCDN